MADMSVAGDEDRWMLLERGSEDGLHLVVRTRINPAIDEFAAQNQVTAVICDVHEHFLREDGMPTCMDALYEDEDRLVVLIATMDETAYHTASATGDGRRTIYIAHSGDQQFRARLGSFTSEVSMVSVFTQFEFETYRDFITPSPIDVQFDGDRKVIATLLEQGDDGSQPRKIDFWFYGDRPRLEKLVQRITSRGFVLDHWIDGPAGVVVSLEAPANFASFADLTPHLVDSADEAGVQYDGWETFVIGHGVPAQPSKPKPAFFSRFFGQKKH